MSTRLDLRELRQRLLAILETLPDLSTEVERSRLLAYLPIRLRAGIPRNTSALIDFANIIDACANWEAPPDDPRAQPLGILLATIRDYTQGPATLQLRDLILAQPPGLVPDQAPPPCPYPGLEPFNLAFSPYFCGRDAEITHLLDGLRDQTYLLVVGASGSGKSSLIQAGLLARLPESRAWSPDTWHTVTLRPGAQPLGTLGAAFGEETLFQTSALRREVVADAVGRLLARQTPPAQRLLLVIDQLEELYTQASSSTRAGFCAALMTLKALDTCAVILVLRADFYDPFLQSPLWDAERPLVSIARLDLAPLNDAGLRAAISEPARAVGVTVAPELVERLLADAPALDAPGRLPLLQATLARLWEGLPGHLLPLTAYTALNDGTRNGVALVVERTAERALAPLTEAERQIAQRICLRLVQFGEKPEHDTRRQQPLAALAIAGEEPAQFDRVLKQLAAARLLILDRDPATGVPVADLAHEILLTAWPRLQVWIASARSAEQQRRSLEAQAAQWQARGRGSTGLLDAGELADAQRWLAAPAATALGGASPALQALLAASQQYLRRQRLVLGALLVLALGLVIALFFQGRVLSEYRKAQAHGPRVYITAGPYVLGRVPDTPAPDALAASTPEMPEDDTPPWPTVLPAYWIDTYEISNSRYRWCYEDNGCQKPEDDPNTFLTPTAADYPVVEVTARQAADYCRWQGGNLPTEVQWERAARGPGATPRLWPWGTTPVTPNPTVANMLYDGTSTLQVVTANLPGASLPPEQVFNLVGNAWEWTASFYTADYRHGPLDWDPVSTPSPDDELVIRGGSYTGAPATLPHITTRGHTGWNGPNLEDIGFRCVYPP